MKKIGVISLFGYNNYGNRLQMFAVQKVFKNLGFDSEIVKYRMETTSEPFIIRLKIVIYYLLNLKSSLSKSYLKNCRIYNFKKHAKYYYSESKKYINPSKIENDFQEKYSFFSVGSDQIWGWFIYSIPNFVFLKFAPVEKRITFSPSFGSSMIDEKYRKIFKQGLDGFKSISVREQSGAEIVKNFTGKDAVVLCDPTMCLSKEEWLEFSSTHKRKPTKKYILTYFLGVPSLKVVEVLNHISDEFEIVHLNSLTSSKFYSITPSEWVDYINDADLFLTDSFHGVVFSILLQTPFGVYSRVGGESMHTRITNILEKFSLQDRFEISSNDFSLFSMDFSNTEEIINAEKAKAYKFLKKTLSI
ncbi:MAG: polysaccharide pyruvyl transferase family protein [Weeksellaceae bacterium]|nr:polysaccharide pyruvyl transferase family protein [Weeksellaceae bacterium]